MRWLMNMPVDPRKESQFASWVASRDGDKMDDWRLLLRGETVFGAITIGRPKSAANSAKSYADRGWVGLYCETPEKKKGAYTTRELVRTVGDGV